MVCAISMAVGLFFSPVTICICKRKSTRLIAVIGGLVTALGCLFTSFASQFHQMIFSFGIIKIIYCVRLNKYTIMINKLL